MKSENVLRLLRTASNFIIVIIASIGLVSELGPDNAGSAKPSFNRCDKMKNVLLTLKNIM